MRRFSLFALLLTFAGASADLSANTAVIPAPRDPDDGRYGGQAFIQRHEEFLAAGRKEPGQVVFLGDSITDLWRQEEHNGVPRGKRVWDRVFAPLQALNFGLGGDRTQHVLWRIEHGELDRLNPKAVVLMIGSNNTGVEHATGRPRNLTHEVIAGVTAVVKSLRAKLPDAKILLLAIFPRGAAEQRAQIREVNAALAPLHDGRHIHFLDIGPKFLLPDGEIDRQLLPDRTHPSAAGYEVWARAIEAPLQALLR
jgi:lysophospholipase L1-like esterase